jgi:hypothetical protein
MPKSNLNIGSEVSLKNALSGIPAKFRDRLIKEYLELKGRYSKALFDSGFDLAGLSAGKFCETTIRFLQEILTGSFTPFGTHIQNFADECRKLVVLDKSKGSESLRIIIPRCLVFLYTFRGKRGIGHVGGDVEANKIDSETIIRCADWIICELIRIYHHLSLEEAQALVNAISTRNIPVIWEVAGKKRILRSDISAKDKVLIFAYSAPQDGILIEDLFDWVEYSDMSMFKKSVLQPLHNDKLIEYDKDNDAVFISPIGIELIEAKHLLDFRTS